MVLNIIPREKWGAVEPTKRRPIVHPVENVAEDHWSPQTINQKNLHKPCFTEEECTERAKIIQQFNFDRDQSDLNYSFLIGGDGNVYEGRGWNSLATEDWQWSGYKIGYIGKYTLEEPPPQIMKDVFNELVEYGKKRMYIKDNAYIFPLNREQEMYDEVK